LQPSTKAQARAVVALAAALVAVPATASAQQGGRALEGTFRVLPGSCSGGKADGSWFRMVNPNGTVRRGPYFDNPDSTCADQSYTLLEPGTDGGLITGAFQPRPVDPFDATGNARAGRIVAPVRFGSISFGVATAATDPQTRRRVKAPSIRLTGSRLSGNLAALSVDWNDQAFNQGSPKPGGARPGKTSRVTGMLNRATNEFTLRWSSQIRGGAFNRFTGVWQLKGRFVPRS
jgi:hypothetical protein